jgi:hypothetical protein
MKCQVAPDNLADTIVKQVKREYPEIEFNRASKINA